MQVSNDGGFFEAQWEPYRLHRDWQITSYGSTTLPRTVYIRYRDTVGTMSFTYQDDIILDVTAPSAELAQLVPSVGSLRGNQRPCTGSSSDCSALDGK